VWVGLDGCWGCCFALDHRALIDFDGQVFFTNTFSCASHFCVVEVIIGLGVIDLCYLLPLQ
jgi:hypothetical protein